MYRQKLCTGCTAHSRNTGISLLFLDHGTRSGWGVSPTPRPLFIPGTSRASLHCTLTFYIVVTHTSIYIYIYWHAVVQLVEALRYKPEGRWFNSRLCNWNYSLTKPIRPHYGIGVDSARNKNEYHQYFLCGKGGRCVGLTNLTFMCRFSSNLEASNPWKPQGLSRAVMGRLYIYMYIKGRAWFQRHRYASCHQVLSPCKAKRRRKFTPVWQKY